MHTRQLDEPENRVGRDGAAGFVVVQGPERDSQGLGQKWASVFAVESDPNLAKSYREIALECLPVRIGKNFGWGRGRFMSIFRTAPASPS